MDTTERAGDYELDFLDTFEDGGPELDFVLPGFLAGTVGSLVAPGATGKTFLTLEAAMSVACEGVDLLGLGLKQHGKVLMLSAEDPLIVLRKRGHAIGKLLSISQRIEVADNFTLKVRNPEAFTWDIGRDGTLDRFTEWGEGKRLIVLDTIIRFHSKDENSNSEMVQIMAALELLAARTGAAVLYLHHVNKGAAAAGDNGQHASRGASVLTDNARWGAALTKDGDLEQLKFNIPKNNYSAPIGDLYYKRVEGGVLVPVEAPAEKSTKSGSGKKPNENLQAIFGEEDNDGVW
jgi:RecA-family ATPase